MPLPTPPTPSQRTVFDLARSHVQLPINRDYGALKRVLHDWLAYSVRTPLQTRPAFAAELLITITRTPPPANSRSVAGGGIGGAAHAGASTSGHAGRRWALWRTRWSRDTADEPAAAAATGASASASGPSAAAGAPLVYRKVVPLHVWTAVLPWEMQRGLSFSDLRLPSSSPVPANSTATPTERAAAAPPDDVSANVTRRAGSEAAEEKEEEDPFGIVTPSITGSSGSAAAGGALAEAATAPVLSITPPAPAMLFLSDVEATRAHGIAFWSGAIRQAIDVLFVGPTLPSSVSSASASFQRLRAQDGRARVMDNRLSSEVLRRFFPMQEINAPSSSTSSPSAATFRLHSFAHLDPLPPSLHPSRLGVEDLHSAHRGLAFTAAPDAAVTSLEEAPRYVFEVPRHTLQPAVAAALAESRRLRKPYRPDRDAAQDTQPAHDLDDDATIELVVNMSEPLRSDLFAKAQLCVEYVPLLEDAIAHYTRLLSTDATAVEVPLDGASTGAADDAAGAGRGRLRKVWLSATEHRWMTPEELEQAAEGPTTEQRGRDGRAAQENEEEDTTEESEAAVAVADSVAASAVWRTREGGDHVSLAAAHAVKARPAQPDGVSAARSISLQSPILREEEEGRPSYLAPSFHGRHEAPVLQNSAVVLSADKLARYPRTHSHMPVLPPIDYELYELCMRLGVGQRTVLYHYHERILHEWRRELHTLQHHGGQQATTAVSAPARLAEDDVARMVGLVEDRSLQLPPELVTLVESVSAARRGGAA
ncbi:hypothetical protein NESM_000834600 [Novymonas esmeraldas]|uniref:Uncharacterized protein n=1 Tax=Novymonas esmeraldas TaxID=1808958 RepID=A0AAW0EYT8_9TRYP